uniref:Phosphatidylinositol 4-kinase type 2 n=2 Tax=Panagrolaimus sp. JU765 TaxID=591449 RepID=A0AC34QK19_9BILA
MDLIHLNKVNILGYLSEAGASLIDQKLGLNVVPKTAVVFLAAPTFNYSALDRAKARTKERIRIRYPDLGRRFRRIGLPAKRGSFQLFVSGFQDAIYWLRQWELYPEQSMPPKTQHEFQQQFEKMVILDYIIRNTDRGNDNWLIKYEPARVPSPKPEPSSENLVKSDLVTSQSESVLVDLGENEVVTKPIENEQVKTDDSTKTEVSSGPSMSHVSSASEINDPHNWENITMPVVSIAAIDNGLAFPFKHPDEWRTYPYRWATLPIAQLPFSEETVEKMLPLLDNTDFVRELGNDLKKIFESDPGFDKKLFAKQLAVMRGQIFNLREALRTRKTPAQLVMMPPQYMIEVKQKRRSGRNPNVLNVPVNPPGDETSGLSDAGTGIEAGPSTPLATPQQISELDDPKSWHNTFQQKVQTRSAFFRMW